MKILDTSIEAKLLNSMERALILTSQRIKYAINALPYFSDVWIANPQNFERRDIDQTLRDKYFNNDLQVLNFQSRYLGYFTNVSKRSLDLNLIDFAALTISFLCDQIIDITKSIPEEDYQDYFITHILLDINEVVNLVCEKKIRGAIRYGFLPANLQAIKSEKIALQISKWLTKYFVSMAKADVIDYLIYTETSTAAISASLKYPNASLIFLEAFGEAGKMLKSNKNISHREDLLQILQEMYYKIDNVDSVCQTSKIKTKVSRLAKKIKKEIKI